MRTIRTVAMQARTPGAKMPAQNMNTLYRRRSLLVAAIIFVCASAIYAQSGRRSNGGTTTTTPSVSGPKAIEKKPEKPPRLQLLVGIASRDPFTNIPYYISDTVIAECVHR